jgi:hypothetical protein
MKKEKVQSLISEYFTKIVQKDRKIHNAYLLIHSEKLGIHLNIAITFRKGADKSRCPMFS